MTQVAAQSAEPRIPAVYDPATFRVLPQDREIFARELASFIPDNVFDAHAHWYDMRIFAPGADASSFKRSTWVGHESYQTCMGRWMESRMPRNGLFFPMPARGLDRKEANRLIVEEAARFPDSRCLLIISPNDDPAEVERLARDRSVAGFKVYHLFAPRSDTQSAPPAEYIPEWAWEIADRHGLCIMLHMVLARSLADERNQRYIAERCRKYPNARLILAHAARGFCGRHTVQGIHALRGLGNVFFDTSVVCESAAIQAILEVFGPTRLLFGSDFPLSEARGRSINLGDSYHWIYESDVVPPAPQQVTLVGIESLLAIKEACRTLHLNDSDIERIFSVNAREVLGMLKRPFNADGAGQKLYVEAKTFIPGGTQLVSKRPEQYAPDKWPAYFREARGCEVIDLDGRRYLDFATSGIGTSLLGYNHPAVTSAVLRRIQLGSMSTLNSPEEIELGKILLSWHPWAKKIRLARSGGEALAVAIRIARAGAKRDVVAFCGYHGWSDWYLAANLGESNALDGHLLSGLSPAGVPRNLRGSILPFTYNKIDELQKLVTENGDRLAAVIMEPTRTVPPENNFLHDIRQICDDTDARLIFDEVTSGFRIHRGGVHLKLGVNPDIAVFAKALGNGHPIAAIIGTAGAMDAAQDSFISSTNWTEGVGPTAAISTLREMERIDVPAHVGRVGSLVREGLQTLARKENVPLAISGYPAQTYLGFTHPQADALMTLFVVRMLETGFLCGSAFYPTLAHDEHAVNAFLAAAGPVIGEVGEAIRKEDVVQRIDGKVRHSGFRRLN
jgi:glutamate-1-semialdehyde 2,1-aminomutase